MIKDIIIEFTGQVALVVIGLINPEKKMKQKDFKALDLQKGVIYNVKYRGLSKNDRKTYNCTGEFTGYGESDKNIFKQNNWSNDFYMLYTRQIISVS